MKYSITQFGKPLEKSKYTLDEKTKTFSSNEDNNSLEGVSPLEITFASIFSVSKSIW